ncbi:flagellin [Luteimonas huabeiensis]|uniref:flagellin n=1 Tax=Luteimonas huabeiensis TaxID=1244513 RepID=UPI0004630145|nr:flagellin [Luteimonas huabeiensis]
MSVINTNTIALNAQRNLATNSASLSTTIQRLSSGLRINSAKDDAAGLAISERFSTQIRGMNQAARNANDGISLAQTAEGALGEIGNNLQRIRELAVQSRNATNSASDRQALNAEVEQLKAEIQRVAEQTQFNGTNLLDGSFSGAVFQVGANQGQTITVDGITNANTANLGQWTAPTEPARIALTAADLAAPTGDVDAGFGYAEATITVNGTELTLAAVADAATADAAREARLAQIQSAFAGVQGVSASTADGTLTIVSNADIEIADGAAVAAALVSAETTPGEAVTGFAAETVLTTEAADRMILAMDAALGAVNSARADLGAVQNRFSSVVANLQTSSENLSASRSRIMDTDFAKETAELSRTQILQQAGTAMLAQANQIPQNVLSLLR